MEQQTFINLIKDKAIELQSTYGILASITISQAILESGWFESSLALNANNIFGIKYSEGCGYDKYLIDTKEIENEKEVTVQAYFRKYDNIEDSIKDHAVFLQKPRYKNIIGDTDYKSVANKLYEDGYSTSHEYPSKLIKLIEKYGLNNYDNLFANSNNAKSETNIKGDVLKMKIVLDYGHCLSGADTGAVGCGYKEQECTREIGRLVKTKLESLGHTVIAVAPDSTSSVNSSLSIRVNNCPSDADLFISLHLNAGGGHGTEVFTYNAKELASARRILNNICSLGYTNRGIKDGSKLYVVRATPCNSILAEICFIDNSSDMQRYESNKENLANAITEGITNQKVTGGKYNVQPLSKVSETIIQDKQPSQSVKDNTILSIQKELNKLHIKDSNGNSLAEDGITGANTIYAIKKLQSICKLDVDGIVGHDTQNAINSILAKPLCGLPYRTPTATRYIQYRLGISIDGIFGNGTKKAVAMFQRNNGLDADGLVGNNTWNKLIK